MSSTSENLELPKKVAIAFRRFGIDRNGSFLVAVSGGADSTALLDVLARQVRLPGTVTAVHVYHGIRPEAEGRADLRFVEELSRSHGIELLVQEIDDGKIAEVAADSGRSLEEVAREYRYAAIERAARIARVDWIATGHTKDDQIETVLVRLLQGSSLQGLGGIPWRRGLIIRPLMECSREEIVAYLKSRGLDYRSDSTNSDERYLRNTVRKRLIPVMLDIFPTASEAIRRFAEETGEVNGILDECVNLLLPWEADDMGARVSASLFFRCPPEARKRSVLRLYNECGRNERIPRGFLKPLEKVKSTRSGGLLLSGHGASLEQRGESVFWRPDVVVKTKKSYLIRVFVPSVYHITPTLCLRVSTEPRGSVGGHRIGLPESLIRPPLVVRSRKPGDAIQMKVGNKSLKKLFNEWGVQETLRDSIPVIEDRAGIWAVAGKALGYRDRIRHDNTSIDRPVPSEKEVVFAFEKSGEKL